MTYFKVWFFVSIAALIANIILFMCGEILLSKAIGSFVGATLNGALYLIAHKTYPWKTQP